MRSIARDLQLSVRALRKDMRFTVLALVYLVLGLGGNAAIFSVIQSLLLDPLPYPGAERLVVVWDQREQSGGDPQGGMMVTPYNYFSRRDQSTSFEMMAAVHPKDFTLTGSGEPERIIGAAVSQNLLPLLGVEPALGRLFHPGEDAPESPRLVILSHRFWQRRWGGAESAVGSALTLDDKSYTVIGVLPEEFRDPLGEAELWITLGLRNDTAHDLRSFHSLLTLGRLRGEASLQQAQAELGTISQRLAQEFPDTNAGWGAEIVPLKEHLLGDLRPRLVTLQLAALFVLLIVCANLANLQLVRADRLRYEVAVRTAFGASRRRLLQRFLTESLLLALLGATLGIVLAYALVTRAVELSATGTSTASLRPVEIGGEVLGFTLALTVLSSVVFGVVPALRGSSSNLQGLLKSGARSSSGTASHRFLDTLAVAEITLAVMLLIGAGLMLKSFQSVVRVDPGFDMGDALVVRTKLPWRHYTDFDRRGELVRQLVEGVGAFPEVRSAAVTTTLPMAADDYMGMFTIRGRAPASDSELLFARFALVTPGYLEMMGISLLDGRTLDAGDDGEAPGAVVVSAAMAETYWPGQSPLGQQIQRARRPDPEKPWLTVVGVVEDVKYQGAREATEPAYYLCYAQHTAENLALSVTLVVRTGSEPRELTTRVRRELGELDPALAIHEVTTLDELFHATFSDHRAGTLWIGLFAAVALLLAVVGVYGVISYFVSQRTREMGVRMALGARRPDLVKLVLGRGLLLALAGLAAGLVGAGFLTRYLASQLYEVSPLDLPTYSAAAAFLVVTALAASFLPARKASNLDPMETLRHE